MTRDWSRLFCALAISAMPAAAHAQPAQPAAPGLGSVLHPLKVEQLTLHQQAQALPQAQKDKVHFFLVNGLDPLYNANLNGVAAYFRSIGFTNSSCYKFPQTPKVRREIEALRRRDPEARIVLLGFSTGANCVRGLANNVQKDGVHIDCLIYLAGDTIFNTPTSKPANVGQIVNITGHGIIFLGRDIYFKGDNIDGAINQRLDTRHMNMPGRNETINLIGQQLITLAGRTGPAAIRPASAEMPRRLP